MKTHLDLFSGIGGFAIAAASAGFKTIGFSEIEPHSCAVLKKHWPEIKNYGDIRNIRNFPADLVTGGFPCQPFSVAGKRGGKSDDRALWPEMRRVIEESKPTWVLGENVAGIVSMELDSVLDDLEHLGYAAWPLVIPACAVDARHRRDRVWILGYADGVRSRRAENGQSHHAGNNGDAKGPDELCEPARPGGARKENVADADKPGLEGTIATRPARADGCTAECSGYVADANGELLNGSGNARAGRRAESANGGEALADTASGQDNGREREDVASAEGCGQRLNAAADIGGEDGQPRIWQPESGFRRVANGIPNRTHRLRGLGNAIVPQVAEIILRAIVHSDL